MEPGTAEPPNPPRTIAESPNPRDGNGERPFGAAEPSPGTAGPQLGCPECCRALRAPCPVFESVRLLQSMGARRCTRENFPGITARRSPSALIYISVPTDSVLSQIKIFEKKNHQLCLHIVPVESCPCPHFRVGLKVQTHRPSLREARRAPAPKARDSP